MNLMYIISKGLKKILNPPALKKCEIDKKAKICSGSELTNVKIDKYSYIGNRCFMVNVKIGKFCSIADCCCIGAAEHPIQHVSTSPVFHDGKNILKKNYVMFERPKTKHTIIENDVWIGRGAYIKSGITIHNGAIVGMGSVVTKDVPSYEIWAGNPARKIGTRFPNEICIELEKHHWWNWNDSQLLEVVDCFDDPIKLLDKIRKHI